MSAPTIDTAAATDATAEPLEDGTVVSTETNTIPREVAEYWAAVSDAADNAPEELKDKTTDTMVELRRLFGALDKDGKRQARAIVRDAKDTELATAGEKQATDPAAAMAHMGRSFALLNVINNGFSALAPAGSPKTAADPVAAAVALTAQIQLAYAVSMAEAPAGISAEDYQARVSASLSENDQAHAQSYRAWLENGQTGTEPEVSDLAKAAARISLGRGPKGQGRKPKSAETAPAADPAATVDGIDTGDDAE
ncbi:hypothetical protein SEA_CAMERICO_95 [Gordonia phage Camerico]|nr:hypothetical protein SEA_CAMERICO_95 [Gordonia phage Camerico]